MQGDLFGEEPECEFDEKSLEESDPGSKGRASVVGYFVTMIAKNLGNGDRAELRRAQPDEPFSPALWRLLAGREDLRDISDEEVAKWGVFLSALSQGYELHDLGAPLGKALHEAGYSELRLTKLLRASPEQLVDEVRSVARFVSSKRVRLNWTELADLLFNEPEGDMGKSTRRYIARRYYSAEYHSKSS